ncbi:MAG: tripartite tricarboxylate transporter substrate binding protein [Kiloniellales bacterium]
MNLVKTTAFALAAALIGGGAAIAEDYPTKSVDYIIPFGPGGESDVTARLQQPFFKELTGQDLVVSYKPGGGGAVGWAQLNSMPGDGYTIMGVNLPHIIVKPQQGDVGFKTDDLVPVHIFHYTPDAIVVREDSDFKTLKDLVEYAKENPKKVIFSGSGKGTANHLAQVNFDKMAGIETTYVAFKGTGAAVAALLGDQVGAEWGYTTVGAKQGDKVRMLAVAMDDRHPLFPDVPTFKELGYDLVSGAYRGIAVPASASEDTRLAVASIIDRINGNPDFQKQMLDGGFAMVNVGYGADMDSFMAEKAEGYIAAAKEAGIIK